MQNPTFGGALVTDNGGIRSGEDEFLSRNSCVNVLEVLRFTRVEANIDSKMTKGQGSLKGFFKGRVCWGLPQRL